MTTGIKARDLAQGSVGQLLFSLSVPTTVQWALATGSNLVLAWWLGKLGGTALAASAAATALRLVIISPIMGLSAGGQAVVGRLLGAGRSERADRALAQAVLLFLIFVGVCSVIGFVGVETFFGWMGYEGAVLEGAIAYAQVLFAGLLFVEILPSMNGVLLAAGRPLYIMMVYAIQLAVTIAVLPFLVPAYGITGAALGQLVGVAAASMAQLIVLFSGAAGIRLRFRNMLPDWPLIRRILRIALPTSAQRLSPNIRGAVLVALVTLLGDAHLAAYSLLWRIMNFSLTPSSGISGPAAALVGQNIGAKSPDRAARAARLATFWAIVITALLQLIILFLPNTILGWFTADQPTIDAARLVLPFGLFMAVGHAWNRVMASVMAAAGDAAANLWLNLVGVIGIQLGLAWLFSQPLGLGARGLWAGSAIGAVASGVVLSLRFRQGKWRQRFV